MEMRQERTSSYFSRFFDVKMTPADTLIISIAYTCQHIRIGLCRFATALNTKYIFSQPAVNINLLLTKREGRVGEYWPEVVTVRTERSEVRTKTTEGQYSPVQPEQARLVSSLLYGTLFRIVKCTSGGLHLKIVRLLHPSLKFRKNLNLFSFCWYFHCEE